MTAIAEQTAEVSAERVRVAAWSLLFSPKCAQQARDRLATFVTGRPTFVRVDDVVLDGPHYHQARAYLEGAVRAFDRRDLGAVAVNLNGLARLLGSELRLGTGCHERRVFDWQGVR